MADGYWRYGEARQAQSQAMPQMVGKRSRSDYGKKTNQKTTLISTIYFFFLSPLVFFVTYVIQIRVLRIIAFNPVWSLRKPKKIK